MPPPFLTTSCLIEIIEGEAKSPTKMENLPNMHPRAGQHFDTARGLPVGFKYVNYLSITLFYLYV